MAKSRSRSWDLLILPSGGIKGHLAVHGFLGFQGLGFRVLGF